MRQWNKHSRRLAGIQKARRVIRIWRSVAGGRDNESYEDGSQLEKRMIRTRVRCSCPMCGNPRRYSRERTRQELIAMDSAVYDLKG